MPVFDFNPAPIASPEPHFVERAPGPRQDLGVLRFITAGSVDDGKSTLIGRLLYDSKAVLADQLSAISRSKNSRVAQGEIDLSLLTDGLEAEREQGITIDVAYRYFATSKRKFIIADTPGHEQYTRNMVTGASTAHAAIILVDPTRVENEDDGRLRLLPQTKRHSALVKLLGLRHVIVAINKMDLIEYSQARFEAIKSAYLDLAALLGLSGIQFIPVSALKGDNIVGASDKMPWHSGLPLLSLLESLPVDPPVGKPLRFPVQWVARQDGAKSDAFRGYMGRVESGKICVGDSISVMPSNQRATVARILAPIPGGLAFADRALAGQAATIQLSEDVDVSRGDIFVHQAAASPVKRIQADLCWFGDEPLSLKRKYLLKHATQTVFSKIDRVESVLDVRTLFELQGDRPFSMNDIGRVSLTVQKPLLADLYELLPLTGAFVLIDETTHHTVAAGMIRALLP